MRVFGRRVRLGHLYIGAFTGLFLVAALFLSEPPGIRSTGDAPAAGGGSGPAMDVADLPKYAHVAVEGRVARILPTVANTADGRLPPVDLARGPDQWNGIYPLTRLVIEVDRVLGQRDALRGNAPGLDRALQRKVVVVELTGGTMTTTLSAEEARALGVELADGQLEEVEIATAVAPGVLVSEGDHLALFLVDDDRPNDDVVRVVGEGVGAFLVGGDGHSEHVHSATEEAGDSLGWVKLQALADNLGTLSPKPLPEGE